MSRLEFRGETTDGEKDIRQFVQLGKGKGWKLPMEVVQPYVRKRVDIFFRTSFINQTILNVFITHGGLEVVVERFHTLLALN